MLTHTKVSSINMLNKGLRKIPLPGLMPYKIGEVLCRVF